jgi:hypothetical protein
LLVQTASSNITSSERLTVAGTGTIAANSTSVPAIYAQNTDTTASTNQPYIYLHDGTASRAGLGVNYTDSALVLNGLAGIYFRYGGNGMGTTEGMRITSAGFTQPVAYADTVSALGNTGTAKTIDLKTANVFTATLTGNCTFTLSNPIATGSSSFTLILTNDGTAGRTVAWSGGSFVFPGGAASLSRTTTANAVDVWVFFTPNGGTTWYGNIAMKNMTA